LPAIKPGWLPGMIVTIAYLWIVFIIGVMVVYLYDIIRPTDFTSPSGAVIAAVIFTGIAVLDLGLLTLKRVTPAIIVIVFVIAPYLVLYRLLKNTDLLIVDTNTPDRIAKYVFVKRQYLPLTN